MQVELIAMDRVNSIIMFKKFYGKTQHIFILFISDNKTYNFREKVYENHHSFFTLFRGCSFVLRPLLLFFPRGSSSFSEKHSNIMDTFFPRWPKYKLYGETCKVTLPYEREY